MEQKEGSKTHCLVREDAVIDSGLEKEEDYGIDF